VKIRIAAPITAKTQDEALTLIGKAERDGADLIELRLDYLNEKVDLKRILGSTGLATIAANRPRGEGGYFQGGEEERIEKLVEAAEKGFNYVDVEISTKNIGSIVRKLRDTGAKPIVSYHNFDGTPVYRRLLEILAWETKLGADVCKIVTTARSHRDNFQTLKLLSAKAEGRNIVCFAMGEIGIPTRVMSPLLGGFFTFGAVQEGYESASGQITVAALRKIYSLMRLTK